MPRIFSINLGGGGSPVDPFTLIGRTGEVAISNAAQTAAVVFSASMGTTNYAISWSIKNTVDSDPIYPSGVITVKDNDGFTVELNAPVDSGNYVLEYLVAGFL